MLAVVCPIEGAVPERYGQLIDTVLQNAKKVSGDKKDTEAAVILRDEKDFLYWCETQKKPGSCIVFAVHLDRSGINLRLYAILKEMDYHTDCLLGCIGAILVDGENELYTKNMAKKIAFSLNRAGCMLPGHTFAEATGSLKNQTRNAMHRNLSLKEAFFANAGEAVCHALEYADGCTPAHTDRPARLLCIYAGNKQKSNTCLFWKLVRKFLTEDKIVIREINLRNGEVADCLGCPFEVCLHYSEKGSCFYGGVMVEQVYPALLESDALMILSPNYNDSVSANIMAFINRLTALYRKGDFKDKLLFSIVVSGYSGSDILAEQLISSLHFNKGFALPAHAIRMLTANDPGEILSCKDIEKEAEVYAERITAHLGALRQKI